MVEIAGILTFIRVQILEVCKEWVEMKDICARTQKSRTTVLHHMEVLKNAGMIEETMIGVMRTRKIPVVLTFMAYHSQESIPKGDRSFYPLQKRTSNEYHAISAGAWEIVMMRWRNNDLVFSCGKFGCVGHGASGCRYCGVCLREYHATKTRIFEGEMLET